MRQIFFDTETTGLEWKNGDRVVEIGAVEVVDRAATGRVFHCYLNPEDRHMDDDATSITQLTQEFLEKQPLFKEKWPEFKEFLAGADQLIAHNAEFDIAFLNAEIKRVEPRAAALDKQFKVIDSLAIARVKFPGQRNSLDALCKRYKIDLSQRKAKGHGALLDAELLYMVYSALTEGEQALLDFDVDGGEGGEDGGGEKTLEAASFTAVAEDRDSVLHNHKLKVLAADALEMAAHQKLLKQIQNSSKSKQTIWSEAYGEQ